MDRIINRIRNILEDKTCKSKYIPKDELEVIYAVLKKELKTVKVFTEYRIEKEKK